MTQPAIKEAEPTTVEPSSGFTDFILHRLHVAALRAKIVANEIEATMTALSAGLISPEMVIQILTETGVIFAETGVELSS